MDKVGTLTGYKTSETDRLRKRKEESGKVGENWLEMEHQLIYFPSFILFFYSF